MAAGAIFNLTTTMDSSAHSNHLRVLSVIPGESSGASMIFAKRQIESLRDLGVDCSEFYLSSRSHPVRLCREAKRLRAEIARVQPDVVHAHYGTVTSLLCALTSPVPLVITFRGSDLNPIFKTGSVTSRIRSFAGTFFSQLAALRARKIICVSAQLKERLWWKKDCAAVFPTGVDTSLFFPRRRSECRAELGWDESERVVLFNGGKNPLNKRLDMAQSAVDVAQKICGEIKFINLDGSTMPSTVPLLLNAADCLLVTSEYEGSPTIVQESLACNLPVVSVDVGDVKERLNGVFPSAIAERDVADLASLVSKIITNPVRSNGYVSISEISQTNIARKIVSLYLACKS